MKKGKGIESLDVEFPLPEAMIQHIQSFMSRKEAARTTILSKSWYNAFLTLPVLDFDDRDFYKSDYGYQQYVLEFFAMRTMLRYQRSKLKIERFKLHNNTYHDNSLTAREMIVCAMEIGATDVQLEIGLPCYPYYKELPLFLLPQQVLESRTLLRLCLTRFRVGSNSVSCSRLKSLTLEHVEFKSVDVFKDIVTRCISIEELSLSKCTVSEPPGLKHMILFELHKLRRLYLDSMDVDNMFFTKFESRFPSLKDLSICQCHGFTKLQIASTSLETISFKPARGSQRSEFDVPSIRKFTYSGSGLPHLSIKAASKEWELDITINCNRFHKISWFQNLKKSMTKFRLSRIYLSLVLECEERFVFEHEVEAEVVQKPLVVENLMVSVPSTFRSALLLRLLGIFRPKFMIYDDFRLRDRCNLWRKYAPNYEISRKRLIQLLITSDCQNMFGKLGLKKLYVEAYKKFDSEWRPIGLEELETSETPANYQKIRLKLIWEETFDATLSLPI